MEDTSPKKQDSNAADDVKLIYCPCCYHDPHEDPVDPELPSLDYKNNGRQVDLKTRRTHGCRFMGRVSIRLADPEVVAKLTKLNPHGSTFIDIKPWPASLSIDFQEPLSTLRFPWDFYDEKTKCPGLISQANYLKYKDDTEKEGFLAFPKVCLNGILSFWSRKTPKDLKADLAPHITAFLFKWRNKLVIEQDRSTSRQHFEHLPTTSRIQFDSKLFTHKVRQLAHKIAQVQNDVVHVLDTNEISDSSTVLETTISTPMETQGSSENLHIYSDNTQHKLLLVPVCSKKGFEMAHTLNPHSFPFSARFKLGDRILEREFDLNLSFTKEQQQYCLAFYFPENNGVITLIKLMLSVNCIFPTSAEVAQLTACFPEPQAARPSFTKIPGDMNTEDRAVFNPDALAEDFVSHVCDRLAEADIPNRDKSLQLCYEAGWRHHEKNTYQYGFRKGSGRSAQDKCYYIVEKHKKKQDMLGNMKSDYKYWNSS